MSGEYLYVAEYSTSQNSFHVQRLREALAMNRDRIFRKDPGNDWVIFALGEKIRVEQAILEAREAHRLLPKKTKGRRRYEDQA